MRGLFFALRQMMSARPGGIGGLVGRPETGSNGARPELSGLGVVRTAGRHGIGGLVGRPETGSHGTKPELSVLGVVRAAGRHGIGGAVLAGLVIAVLAVTGPAWAADEDPNLEQNLAADADLAQGERVLATGHVDLGPKFVGQDWTLLVHDDVAKADPGGVSVWRHPAETVIHVLDQAILTVPDDPAYQFVGAAAGEAVWVVPQTQNPEAVWLGWNTQDPEVMERIDRGVTLSLTGAEGPGTVTVYLQSGAFGEPALLFDSRVTEPQSVWVDVNTHTHANWVFTKPGVYLLELTVEADLIDGTPVTDSQMIRFAVGTAMDPAEALAERWREPSAGASAPTSASEDGAGAEESGPAEPASGRAGGGLVTVLIAAIALVSALLAAGVGVGVARGRRAQRRALESLVTRPGGLKGQNGGTGGRSGVLDGDSAAAQSRPSGGARAENSEPPDPPNAARGQDGGGR
jgi:putative ABC transporter-associated repeat protein